MALVFDKIPGMVMPVSEVVSTMAKMWDTEPVKGHAAPSEFRASQMNLVLHLGLGTTPEEAESLFRTVNDFAHVYPSRIIILCPTPVEDADILLKGKLYSECYIGKSRRDMRCCEILTLGYDIENSGYLESQVSVWLESDLPTYYWSHRLPTARLNTAYKDFISNCKRKVYDSNIEGSEFRGQLEDPDAYRNLSYARLLPIRQTIGQILSGFEPGTLADELKEATLNCSPEYFGEGGALSRWIFNCLSGCANLAGNSLLISEVAVTTSPESADQDFELHFEYKGQKSLRFICDISSGTACLTGNLGRNDFSYTLRSGLLSPEAALAEAIFFNN